MATIQVQAPWPAEEFTSILVNEAIGQTFGVHGFVRRDAAGNFVNAGATPVPGAAATDPALLTNIAFNIEPARNHPALGDNNLLEVAHPSTLIEMTLLGAITTQAQVMSGARYGLSISNGVYVADLAKTTDTIIEVVQLVRRGIFTGIKAVYGRRAAPTTPDEMTTGTVGDSNPRVLVRIRPAASIAGTNVNH